MPDRDGKAPADVKDTPYARLAELTQAAAPARRARKRPRKAVATPA